MNKLIGPILIVLGLVLGFSGFTQMGDAGSSLEIGKLEITAEDSGAKNQAYLLMGGGALCLILGAGLTLNKGKN